jgi:hypothetical protein
MTTDYYTRQEINKLQSNIYYLSKEIFMIKNPYIAEAGDTFIKFGLKGLKVILKKYFNPSDLYSGSGFQIIDTKTVMYAMDKISGLREYRNVYEIFNFDIQYSIGVFEESIIKEIIECGYLKKEGYLKNGENL